MANKLRVSWPGDRLCHSCFYTALNISAGVIFHTDRGSTYPAARFTAWCARLGIRQSTGRVGSCFENAAAEAFFSSLEWEVLSRNEFGDTVLARAVVIDWCYTFYNHQLRSRQALARQRRVPGQRARAESRIRKPSTISGEPQVGSLGRLFSVRLTSADLFAICNIPLGICNMSVGCLRSGSCSTTTQE